MPKSVPCIICYKGICVSNLSLHNFLDNSYKCSIFQVHCTVHTMVLTVAHILDSLIYFSLAALIFVGLRLLKEYSHFFRTSSNNHIVWQLLLFLSVSISAPLWLFFLTYLLVCDQRYCHILWKWTDWTCLRLCATYEYGKSETGLQKMERGSKTGINWTPTSIWCPLFTYQNIFGSDQL